MGKNGDLNLCKCPINKKGDEMYVIIINKYVNQLVIMDDKNVIQIFDEAKMCV